MTAASSVIASVRAVEILDSRARPTLAVTVVRDDGTVARAGVPSGGSTGSGEAVELRDGDPHRYAGQGVIGAVGNVNGPIAQALMGRRLADLEELDRTLIDLDGTENKSRLGANAIVGVSMATARAIASARRIPLWRSLTPTGVTPRLPVPHFNVINGGAHAPNNLDFQEFMIAPLGAPSVAEAIRAGAQTYQQLKTILAKRRLATGLGDEGGFAPDIDRPEEVLQLLVEAIEAAGYTPGRDGIAIALDPAASEFARDDRYRVAGQRLMTGDMIDWYAELVRDFPIWSIEDGLAENDWTGWKDLTDKLGDRVQLVGDDIFVTNPPSSPTRSAAASATPR